MNIINNNPYRVLDLSITASERETAKQIEKLQTYIEMGKSFTLFSNFKFLPSILRTTSGIEEAKKSIEQIENRLFYSFFWFWRNNSADEISLDVLAEGNTQKAIDLWKKQIAIKSKNDSGINEISGTAGNTSNIKNLSTLYLSLAIREKKFFIEYFKKGIELACSFFKSDCFKDYVILIAGPKYVYNGEKALKFYLNEIISSLNEFLDQSGGIAASELLVSLSCFPPETKQFLQSRFITKPIQNIEMEIEDAKKACIAKPGNAIGYCKNLLKNTKSDLEFLVSALGSSDFQYQIIADKLADQITQCGIRFYNETKNDEDFLSYYEQAIEIAVSAAARDKAAESLKGCKLSIDQNTCWFCGLYKGEMKSNYSKMMYKVNHFQHNYSHITIPVSRCIKCKSLHSSSENMTGLLSFSLLAFGIIIGATMDGHWIIGGIVGVVAGAGLGSAIQSGRYSNAKIKGIETISQYPLVKQMLSEGWTFQDPNK